MDTLQPNLIISHAPNVPAVSVVERAAGPRPGDRSQWTEVPINTLTLTLSHRSKNWSSGEGIKNSTTVRSLRCRVVFTTLWRAIAAA